VNFIFENGGTNDGIVSMTDQNGNGVIEQGECYMPWAQAQGTSGYLPPFSQRYGAYFTSLIGLEDHILPGPFGAGIETIGDACFSATNGMKPVMEVWNGIPQIGNLAIEVGCIRGLPGLPAFFMGDYSLAPTPLDLRPLGFAAGCYSYLSNPLPIAITFGDPNGAHKLNIGIANNPTFVGANLAFQLALLDPAATNRINYAVTNAMRWTIQP